MNLWPFSTIEKLRDENQRLTELNAQLHSDLAAAKVEGISEKQMLLEKLSERDRVIAALTRWIKVTHRLNELPVSGTIKDLLQRR